MNFSSIEQALETLKMGEIVIVVDDEDRENEGDFVSAAETITAEKVNFMLKARGLFCVTLTEERAKALKLKPAVDTNTALHGTAFTVSVDHRSTVTGVSAQDRTATTLALADAGTKPDDLIRPGHVFPIIARDGGVLKRAGHTEASVDLARLAGLKPAGVLIEILNEDGTMARRDRLHEIARQHGMPIVTIADLIRYRYRHERLVKRAAEATLPTPYGEFRIIGYEVAHEDQEPIALVKGEITKVGAPLVRVHSSCFTGDVLESLRCDCGDQLHLAMAMIANEGVGAIVYLPQEGRGIGIIEKIKAYQLQEQGMDTVEANLALGHGADLRDYGVGIQIIRDLGLSKVRLLTNNPKKTDAFIYYGYDLTVVDQLPLIAPQNPEVVRYLDAKRRKMGHRLQAEFGSRSVLHSDGL